VRAGDEISHYYDPMIAKLVAWGEDRGAALRRLRSALAAYQVVGVATNISFLQRLIAHHAFADAQLDTGLITRHHDALFPPAGPPDETTLAIAALAELGRLRDEAAGWAGTSADRWSPWNAIESWWLNAGAHAIALIFESGEANYPVGLRVAGDAVVVRIDGREAAASVLSAGDELELEFAGKRVRATVVVLGEERYVFCEGSMRRLRLVDPLAHAGEEEPHAGHLAAPMSGTVIAVLVAPGDSVARGAPLLVLEAMKMEHTVAAPAAGIVSAVNYKAGDQVREGADLIDLDAAAPSRTTA
jgi:3-methylcrotonyl-CoA carboxylase alpha subunit